MMDRDWQRISVCVSVGYWVILDQAIPSFTELVIEGTLDLDHGPTKDNDITIDVTYLYIYGGRLIIGCEESAPYEGKASIVLRGTASTTPYPVTEGPNVGSKVIGKVSLKTMKTFSLKYWGRIVNREIVN